MEAGIIIASQLLKIVIKEVGWKSIFNWLKKYLPEKNIFRKDRFVLVMKTDMIFNSEIRKEINLRLNFLNFHSKEIKIEKVKLSIYFDNHLVAEFKESLSGHEQLNLYDWKISVDTTIMNNLMRFFFQNPDNPKFYYSNGNLKFNFKIHYVYNKEKGEVDYDLFSILEMDTRKHI